MLQLKYHCILIRLRQRGEGGYCLSVSPLSVLFLERRSLAHVITAAAMNVVRAVNWPEGVPLAKTRQSHFARLAPDKAG